MEIYFDGEFTLSEDIKEKLYEAADLVLKDEGITQEHIEISVTFVSGDEIRQLNKDYRSVDKVTDVLSFPQFNSSQEIRNAREYISLGDVIICNDKVCEQAEDFGHSYEREILYLFVHSILHLLGYDHMEDDEKKVMRAQEEKILKQMGITREE